MEADVIIPLLLADCQKTRVILAGDHRQTTEKVGFTVEQMSLIFSINMFNLCFKMYSDERGQVKTLLERLYEVPRKEKVITIRLRNNYR